MKQLFKKRMAQVMAVLRGCDKLCHGLTLPANAIVKELTEQRKNGESKWGIKKLESREYCAS